MSRLSASHALSAPSYDTAGQGQFDGELLGLYDAGQHVAVLPHQQQTKAVCAPQPPCRHAPEYSRGPRSAMAVTRSPCAFLRHATSVSSPFLPMDQALQGGVSGRRGHTFSWFAA